MKMIDVIVKLANGEIEDQTVLEIYDPNHKVNTYTFNGETKTFYNGYMELYFFKLDDKFLNFDVKLVPPKEKKYLIKLTLKGVMDTYLNCSRQTGVLFLSDSSEGQYSRTKFTKQEIQDAQPIREFLEDMKGKYQLIEVE